MTVVDVWTVDVDGLSGAAQAALGGVLAPGERARAARFAQERDRRRSLLRRGALRCVLAGYLGCPAAAVELAVGPHGRPDVVGADLSFSVSHSGDLTAIAVCAGARVGLDVERLRPVPGHEAMAEVVCTPDERARIAGLDAAARDGAFLAVWTVKEAVLKALGVGLSADPRDVVVDLADDGARVRAGDARLAGWTVRGCLHPFRADVVTALAVAAADARIRWRPSPTPRGGPHVRT